MVLVMVLAVVLTIPGHGLNIVSGCICIGIARRSDSTGIGSGCGMNLIIGNGQGRDVGVIVIFLLSRAQSIDSLSVEDLSSYIAPLIQTSPLQVPLGFVSTIQNILPNIFLFPQFRKDSYCSKKFSKY